MKAYLGIDPGMAGGFAILAEGKAPYAIPMPETERDIWDAVRGFHAWADKETVAVIEQVSAMPKNGAVSMFNFGKGYGGLRMALIAAGIPFTEARPQVWQKALGCLTGGDKNVSLAKAQQMFPAAPWGKTKKHNLAIADALLIAEYARRMK